MITKTIVLSPLAEDDLAGLANWTAQTFGARQAEAYVDAVLDAIDELLAGQAPLRSKARDEIAEGLRSLHMAKPGRRGRHMLLYREENGVVTIVRILHDSMELRRHLPEEES